jgi:hypothetical protein
LSTPYILTPYSSYVPQNVSEIMDLLGWMMLASPTFVDRTGYFPGRNIDTEFSALNESFKVIRKTLGEERYAKMVELSDRMRAHFEADPEDKTEDSMAGRRLIYEMEDLLREKRKT